MNQPWFAKKTFEIFAALDSGETGLTKEVAARRLGEYGQNRLPEPKSDSLPLVFFRQFQSPLIYILLTASAVVFTMGDVVDSVIILLVLIFNAIVGTIQEGRAQNTLQALRHFVETSATVIRGGQEYIIPGHGVAPGDVLVLTEGDRVAADARLFVSHSVKIDEASLTGESQPVEKTSENISRNKLPVAEQKNMVFQGTHVVAGNGKAVVVATGTNSIIGQIAKKISTIDTEIPLKANIRYLSRVIIIATAAIGGLLFSLGLSQGKSATEMFATVVSLAVSIIPEGLPVVVTLILATGVWRMSKRNALVKRLQAVEALGQARIIAVDKTGTITKNELVIQKAYVDDKTFSISGIGYEPKGDVRLGENLIDPLAHDELLFLGKLAAFSSNAHAAYDEDQKIWRVFGDPTETALSVFAEKIGFRKDDLERESPVVAELPFDSTTRYHAIVHSIEKRLLLSVVGAPETILNLSTKIWNGGGPRRLGAKDKKNLESIFTQMSQDGLRVLALAAREDAPKTLLHKDIQNLTFVGFVGMKDALRTEVKEAMNRAKNANIRVVMITGDHVLTARAIAKEADIYNEGDEVLSGQDLDLLSDYELSQKIDSITVFARVTPEHKLRIIEAFRKQKYIVAMTGDGVNDAPSLVAADLGVAMGKIGTEVAKEAADIVLLDDNFGSIISAVEEGRNIYNTIKKVVLYLFSTSLGEVLVISGAMLLSYPLPLLPAQIIWLNFVTDGFLTVALAMEPKEPGLLSGNFQKPKKYLMDTLTVERMVLMGTTMMVGTLVLFNEFFEQDMTKALTVSLTALAVFQWFNAWNCRSTRESIFQTNPFSNRYLIGATAIVVSLQLLAVYHPFMQKFLHTSPLSFSEWLLILPVAASIIVVEEIRKAVRR